MSCPICHNGDLVNGFGDKVLSFKTMTLVVRDVPATICDNCGERYFDGDVTERLLTLAREASAAGVVVDVRQYVAA